VSRPQDGSLLSVADAEGSDELRYGHTDDCPLKIMRFSHWEVRLRAS